MTNASRGEPKMMTAGIDLGDRYSYLCFLDTRSGEVIEEGRLRTTPQTFERRFCSERPLRVAIEAGTHSPRDERQIESMPRSWRGWPGSIRSCWRLSSIEASVPRRTWR